jgi:hypothetical protein
MSSYAETLREFYDGELLGEALYAGLLAAAADERQQRIWGVLLQLETETKAWLRAPMTAAGVSLAEDAAFRVRGEGYARAMAPMAWAQQMQTLQSAIDDQVIPRFADLAQAARERGQPQEEEVCRYMMAHEQAQAELARRELAGEPLDAVLAPVTAQLRFPLPAA